MTDSHNDIVRVTFFVLQQGGASINGGAAGIRTMRRPTTHSGSGLATKGHAQYHFLPK